MNPISGLRPPQSIESIAGVDRVAGVQKPGGPGGAQGASFAGAMSEAMDAVQGLQRNAQLSAARFMAGESEDLHKVALDQQRAAISFDLFLQVRNKVVQAYQEVMRMQV